MTNQSGHKGSGNFADDPQKASEAGRKGGAHSQHGGDAHTAQKSKTGSGQQEQAGQSGQQHGGGSANFADDPEKAREAGRKGGQHAHGGK